MLRTALLMVGGMALLVSLLFIGVASVITQRQIEQRSLGRLNELIESMSVMASIACFAKDATLAKETAEAFTKHSAVRRVTIVAYGQVLATSERRDESTEREEKRTITQALYSPFDAGEKIGEVVLEPAWQLIQKDVHSNVRDMALILFLLTIVVVVVIALVVSHTVIRPVKRISDALHTLDPGSNHVVPTSYGHEADELGRLVRDMNDLLLRLRTSLGQEHELHLQRVLNEKLRLYATMFDNSQEGIIITDRQNHIIAVNRAFSQITGYAGDEVLGKNPHVMSSGRHDQAFYKKMWNEIVTTGYWKGELWNLCKDGQIRPKWYSISIVRDDNGEIINHIAIFSDITERKMAEARIEFLAHHDPLTQLPNRLLARDRFSLALVAAMRDESSVAILYIDLDGFKYVNDTFGHQAGDRLLLSVAERLKSHVRETDTISREGGDEFMIILPGIRDIDIIHRITTDILGKISSPFDIMGHTLGISASIGVACYPQHGTDFDTLLKSADAAMYVAKNSGKNSYRVYTNDMNVDVLDKLKLRAYLSSALQNDEFHIAFQPQVDVMKNRLIGTEVLCRWTHPALGAVPPVRFISLAEESGLIIPLGRWVLEQACRQGKRWFDSGIPPFSIAVNVSAQQFNHSDLIATVQEILGETGFPAQCLELEFTESGLLDNIDRSLDIIDQLRTLGVKLTIDDFGTGYSSLIYLKRFKVEKLKIDRSFVRDIDDTGDLGIVRAIIQMGETLQLSVVAEGVETGMQMKILTDLECHKVQGYLISKPLPPAEFEDFIARWHKQPASSWISQTSRD
ncbi:MAG: EAL domain-containing protein [Candidatus Accumulibacter sp.]|nr:EAL domain-containing protein [Accumulibacter sp.]